MSGCCNKNRRRINSLMMAFNSVLCTVVITATILHHYSSSGSAIRPQQQQLQQQQQQKQLVVDYRIVGVPSQDEYHFQRDIEDVDSHLAMYHNSKTHKGRKPLIDVSQLSHESEGAVIAEENDKKAIKDSRKNVQPQKPLAGTVEVISTSEGKAVNGSVDNGGGKRRLPNAIIIGVKKAGTRALLEYLKMHPDVKAPGPEPHFFDKNYEKGYDWYRNQMPISLPNQLVMEKTPSYYITKDVPSRIYNMSKDTKLLVVVRDPVTRAISDYTQQVQRNPNIKPFEQMAFLDNATEIVNTSWAGIKIGMYIKHLEKWLSYFPLKQIHFVDGEMLISHPAKQLFRVQQFLAINPVINETHFSYNSTKGFPCLVKPQSKGRPHCLGNTKGRTHPKVSEKATQRLKNFYKPYNEKLYDLLGFNFRW